LKILKMASSLKIPDFDDLPEVKGMPKGCAWGVFDKDGEKDVYGTLNLLTPDVVREAAKEVQEGVSVSLKYAVRFVSSPECTLILNTAGPSTPSRSPSQTEMRWSTR
jgi:hypothetical protein